jgi:hypothetical protein
MSRQRAAYDDVVVIAGASRRNVVEPRNVSRCGTYAKASAACVKEHLRARR